MNDTIVESKAVARLKAKVDRANPLKPKLPTLPGYPFADVWGQHAPPGYIVKGVALPGAKTVIFGESGSMKTFAATDIVLHAAANRDWNGRRVRPCGVLVILGEGQQGYQKRLRAWAIAQELETGDTLPVWICPVALDLMAATETLEQWIAAAEAQLGEHVGLVLIDTLSTNLGAGDESVNRDVTIALNNASKAAGNRALVLVHHVGHGDKTRERGAYQIRANADIRILVSRDESNAGRVVTLTCEKAKDDEPFEPITLEWRQVDTGWVDADGDAVTSVVLSSTNRTAVPVRQATGKNQQQMLKLLREAGGRLSREDLRRAWGNSGNDRRRFPEVLSSLCDAGMVDRGIHVVTVIDRTISDGLESEMASADASDVRTLKGVRTDGHLSPVRYSENRTPSDTSDAGAIR